MGPLRLLGEFLVEEGVGGVPYSLSLYMPMRLWAPLPGAAVPSPGRPYATGLAGARPRFAWLNPSAAVARYYDVLCRWT